MTMQGEPGREGAGPTPAAASVPHALDPDSPAAEAARRVLGAALAHLLANRGAAAARDIEGVHQMRVGIRRLRSALALFGRYLEPEATRRFGAELKRLGQVFGAARDWDVFCTETLAAAGRDERVRPWVETLRAAAEAERVAAHDAVADELATPALATLLQGLAAWIGPEDSAFARDRRLERPIRKLAPKALDRMARRVARRGHLRHGADAELHALRKALKKLRYSADDLGGLYKSRKVRPHQRAARRLLKLLGARNDASVAAALADRLAAAHGGALVPAAAAMADWAAARRAKADRKLPRRWAEFAATPPFWR